MVQVEICVESLSGVRASRAAGVARVELCSALGQGGLTPSGGTLAAATALDGIEVAALIRPRAGDFLYSSDEHAVLLRDVDLARELGAAGVALGVLTAQGRVDERRGAELVARAGPVPVTFHRAFDFVTDREVELEALIGLGIRRVLTSGGAPTAWEGRESIASLVRAARGRITVVAAGGVRPENVLELVRATGVDGVHLAASRRVESAMRHRGTGPRLASVERVSEEYAHWETDEARVRALLAALNRR